MMCMLKTISHVCGCQALSLKCHSNCKVLVHMKRYDEHQEECQKRIASYDEKIVHLEEVHMARCVVLISQLYKYIMLHYNITGSEFFNTEAYGSVKTSCRRGPKVFAIPQDSSMFVEINGLMSKSLKH